MLKGAISFFFFFLLLVTHVTAQLFIGEIKNVETNQAVAYAHIVVKDSNIGTVSNQEGVFELNISSFDDAFSIQVSAIGYKTRTLVVHQKDHTKKQLIQLEKSVVELIEVEINYLTPETILEQFHNNYTINYQSDVTVLDVFYRTTFKENGKYVNLLEATVRVTEDQREKKNKIQAEITQQRRSNDYRTEKWSESGNYLYQTLNSNPVLFLSDFLNEKNLKHYNLKRLENSSYNNAPVYVISFIQKETSKKPLYEAMVYFNADDFAIIKANYRFENVDLKIGNQSYNRKMIHTSFAQGSVEYQKIGDWYLPKYLSGDTGFEIIDKETKDTLAFNLLNNEALFTNHQIEEVQTIDQPVKKWGDVYKKPFVYDPEYWNDQNKITPTELYNKAMADLSSHQAIEIQYFNNSANKLLDQTFEKSIHGKLDSILSVYYLTDLFNGVALITIKDTIALKKAYGFADLSTKKELTNFTLFDIGSLTKQFTAAIIMKLAEEYKLNLDDKVGKYLPDYKHGQLVTIHHLLGHTSGIPTFDYENNAYNDEWFMDQIETDVFISKFCSAELEFSPGTKMEYSNSNYLLLTSIIENITGENYYQVVDEMVFKPLRMSNTFSPNNLPDAHIAKGYVPGDGYKLEPDWEKPNMKGVGCIYSNVDDLLIWLNALHDNQLLSVKSIELMTSPLSYYEYYDADFGYSWAISKSTFSTRNKTYFYGGTSLGFYSIITEIPDKGITIILLNNKGNFPRIEITNELINSIESID